MTQFLADTGTSILNTRPHAFVNWVLFDNQMNYVSGSSGFDQVGTDQQLKKHIQTNLPVTNSGYLYIYVSNETPNIDVFFDNVQVTHTRGPLLEENHYYPFGLTMAGISDRALKMGYAENKFKYNEGTELQNKEFFDGSGLELYTTDHRLYDPQTGRFVQIDAYSDQFINWSPYVYAIDDPTLLNDPTGLAISDSTHPQVQQTATVTAHKNNGIIFADNHPRKKNPYYVFGSNAPFYIPYNQTDPSKWDLVKSKQLATFVGTTVKIAIVVIPALKGLKTAYTAIKILQRANAEEIIPETAEQVADQALTKNGAVRRGWTGGGKYSNDGRNGGEILPINDADGNRITYKEYDVWPKVPGYNRGLERVVVGSDKSAYYTGDHYQTFTQIR